MCTDNTFPYLQYYLLLVAGVLACYFDTSPEAMNYREATARARWKMLNHNFISVTSTACNNLVNQQKTKKHMFNFRWRCHAMERHIPQLLNSIFHQAIKACMYYSSFINWWATSPWPSKWFQYFAEKYFVEIFFVRNILPQNIYKPTN